MCYVTHMNEACLRHVTYMDEACLMCYVIYMNSHGKMLMNEVGHGAHVMCHRTYTNSHGKRSRMRRAMAHMWCVMWHIWIVIEEESWKTLMNEACHIRECGMSHIWMQHDSYIHIATWLIHTQGNVMLPLEWEKLLASCDSYTVQQTHTLCDITHL